MNKETKAVSQRAKRFNVEKMAITAMLIALTYVATAFINIPSPIPAAGGLVHLGNVPLFVGAALFGKKSGAIAGAFGMALFDLTSSYVSWAPFTFMIAGFMGYVVGSINEKKKTRGNIILAMIAALGIKIVGYYIAEGIIMGNWYAPMASILGNMIQVVTGAVISFPLIIALKSILSSSSMSRQV